MSHAIGSAGTARRRLLPALLVVALLLVLSPAARAERTLISKQAVNSAGVPGGAIEGACGVASRSGLLYVSDYYRHTIDVFSETGNYESQIPFASASGPCQLASAPGGVLYANDWHEGVSRVLPSVFSFDSEESTGVAVDQASGWVYVNDRTYVAVYEPSGAPVLSEGQPLRIGEGTLSEGYGLAFFEGRLYVPDAGDDTVKVFEPLVDPVDPVTVIDGSSTSRGRFTSLVDAAVAVDPTNGHLLVLDNLQPGYEHPEAALEEFTSSGSFLGQLAQRLIDGGPSGLAFSGSVLYATSGNSEESSVYKFAPYVPSVPASLAPTTSGGVGSAVGLSNAPFAVRAQPRAGAARAPITQAVVIQRGGIRVSFDGRIAPKSLPRNRPAPVKVSVGAQISGSHKGDPPQLRAISIAINRYGRFDSKGLPLCSEREIQPATTQNALAACRDSLIGTGHFAAKVLFSQQAPFPADGKVYAFNARIHGRPAILAHVYGTKPVPTSFTLPFELRPSSGTFGTVMKAQLPNVTGKSGYITGLTMNLGRSFTYRGARHSYLSASCPAPKGLNKVPFPLARAEFSFGGGKHLTSTLVSSCGVR
jgi:hypothetical protein